MWFHFKTGKSHYIVFAIVTFISNFFLTFQVENNNVMQSIETFIEDLNGKKIQIINKTVSVQNDVYKKLQIQSLPSNAVLMMKLISYYEDKFKVANHEPTERETASFSVRIEKGKKTLNTGSRATQRIGLKPKDRYSNNVLIPEVIIA
ncbi:uncharacterized protein LOC126768226 [Nymphalis io]|uniref:uncharacterized protein LOC126768226 n=1 Tax=Inachis io TaxID=171585 RepID=UPI00216A7BE5|nr:uncharacterized protein LOC126768226 [Nymphalis io]